MVDKSITEGMKNWGKSPPTARPKSVGPHDVKKDQTDPNDPGLDPEAYAKDPVSNSIPTGKQPGGPVNIKPKK